MKKLSLLTILGLFCMVSAHASFPVSRTAETTETVVSVESNDDTTLEAAATTTAEYNKWVAAVLAFFLGGFGIHRFYMGMNSQGIMQLVGTLLVITAPIVFVWVIIDFVRILMDKLPK